MTETNDDVIVVTNTESTSSLPTVSKPTMVEQDNTTNTTTTVTIVSDDEDQEEEEEEVKDEVNTRKRRMKKEGHVADDSFLTIEESSSKEEVETEEEEDEDIASNEEDEQDDKESNKEEEDETTPEEKEIIVEDDGGVEEDPHDIREESDASNVANNDTVSITEAQEGEVDDGKEVVAVSIDHEDDEMTAARKDYDASASISPAAKSIGVDVNEDDASPNKTDIHHEQQLGIAIVTPSKEDQSVDEVENVEVKNEVVISSSSPSSSSDCVSSSPLSDAESQLDLNVAVNPSASLASVSSAGEKESSKQVEVEKVEDEGKEGKPFDEESASSSSSSQKANQIQQEEDEPPIEEKVESNENQDNIDTNVNDNDPAPIPDIEEEENVQEKDAQKEEEKVSSDSQPAVDVKEVEPSKNDEEKNKLNIAVAAVTPDIKEGKEKKEDAIPTEITFMTKPRRNLEEKETALRQENDQDEDEANEVTQHVSVAYIQEQLRREEKQHVAYSTNKKQQEELTQVRPSQILSRLKKKKKAKADAKKKSSRRNMEEDDEMEPPPLTIVKIPTKSRDESMESPSEHNVSYGIHTENSSPYQEEKKSQDDVNDEEDIPWDERQLEQKHTADMNAYQFLLDAFRNTTDPRVIKRVSHVSDLTLLKFLKWKPDAKRSYRRIKDFAKLPAKNSGYFGIPTKPLLVSRDMDLYRLLEYDLFAWTAPPPTTVSTHAMIHSNSGVGGVCVGESSPPILLTRIGNLPNDTEDPITICRAALYVVDRLLERSDVQDHGLIVLHDMTNVSIRTIKVLSDLLYDTYGCFPLKIRKMYVYNCPWYISSTGAITRRLSEKLYERTKFVNSVVELKEQLMSDWGTVSAGGNIFQKRENKRLWRIIDGKIKSVPKEEAVGGGSWVSKQYEREIVGADFTSMCDCLSYRRKQPRYKQQDSLEEEGVMKHSNVKRVHSAGARRRGYEYVQGHE